MPGLGGAGRDSLSLKIHNVVYVCPDSQKFNAAYVPVVFDNHTDTLVAAREEMGMPSLFSAITISKTDTSLVAEMSWQGARWAKIGLKSLTESQQVSVHEPDAARDLLVHKYIPPSGHGKPDADYDVLIQDGSFVPTIISKSTAPIPDVRVEIKDLGKSLLPTLYPIISRLAEIPIFDIVEAVVTNYQGVSSPPQVLRLS